MQKAEILANMQLVIKQNINDTALWYKTQFIISKYPMYDMLNNIYDMLRSKPKAKKTAENFRNFLANYNDIIMYRITNEGYFPLYRKVKVMHSKLTRDLDSAVKIFPPWYNKFAKVEHLNLMIPTLEEFISGKNHPMVYSTLKNSSSWFSIIETSHNNICLDGKSFPLKVCKSEDMGSQEQEKPLPNGILKVRLYPTPQQGVKIDKMLSANRYAWNLLAEKTGDKKLFNLSKTKLSERFRPYVKKSGDDGLKKNLFIYDCPDDCFDSAYNDIIKARDAIIAKREAQKSRKEEATELPDQLNYKSKKEGHTSIEIRARSIKYDAEARTLAFYPEYFNGTKKRTNITVANKIRIKTNLAKLGISEFDYSCRLTKYDDKYYLNVPYLRKVEPVEGNRVCAIDPGVRTFLTGYEPAGTVFEIASENEHIYKKKKRIEQLQTKMDKTTSNMKRARIFKIIKRLYRKITNCVNDMHHKASKMLAEMYNEILLPAFDTKNMIRKSDEEHIRKINACTAYKMQTLAHFKFRQLLAHKMQLRKGKLHVCTEEYTSKTCGACGRLNHSLGASKVFVCPNANCNITMDRDANAARNIFIKNIDLLKSNNIALSLQGHML